MRSLSALLTLMLLLFAPGARAADTPTGTVEEFHNQLLSVMKDAPSLGYQGRYQRLEPAIQSAFDLERMVRVTTGIHWRNGTEDQRRRLLEAFRRLSVGTYASRFDAYDGERFVVQGTRPGPQKTTLVSAEVVDSQGDPIPLTYVVLESEGTWKIVDILLENSISELAVRRSEYHRILERNGIEGLIRTLEAKAGELAAG